MRSNILTPLLVLACLGASLPAQDLSNRGRHAALIGDHTARAIGDILTIVVRESHKIKNEDKVDRSKSSSLAASLESYSLGSDAFKTNVLPEVDVRTAQDQSGQAKQEKDSSFTASIAVVVIDVQPNGNLVVAGKRVIQIDDETKTMRLSGLVRRLDVTAANTVTSSQVADARLTFTSEGGNARMTTRGPVARFFDTLIWAVWPF